jgi:DNA polymerase-3 subunit gamma/tau
LEMILLRMLAFKPQGVPQPPRESLNRTDNTTSDSSRESALAKKPEAPAAAPVAAIPARPVPSARPAQAAAVLQIVPTPARSNAPVEAVVAIAPIESPPLEKSKTQPVAVPQQPIDADPLSLERLDNALWVSRFAELGIGGVLGTIASHCCLQRVEHNRLQFVLDSEHSSFFDEAHSQRLQEQLSKQLGTAVIVAIEVGRPEGETPALRRERNRQQRLADARQAIDADPNVQLLRESFGALLDESSVEPLDTKS